MFGFEGAFPALVIAIICALIAVGALIVAIVAAVLWRKRRRKLALWLGMPALLYLSAFLWFFTPRPLPKKVVTLDLSHPSDLSGIPKGTYWFTQPHHCCVDGLVHVRVTLPSGEVIDETTREVYIHVDEQGITKIAFTSLPVTPTAATTKNAPLLGNLLAQCTNRPTAGRLLNDVQRQLATYVPRSELGYYAPFEIGSWEITYGINATFMPSDQIQYYFQIKRARAKRPKA